MNWSNWKPLPSPEVCRTIEGPIGAGVYQIRNRISGQNILFGIGIKCHSRMQSLFPVPFGKGTRNNKEKRQYVFENWRSLEFRTIEVADKLRAKAIEDKLKQQKNHLFNT